MDFAKRAVDHLHYDINPIFRSRLDNDFYKLLMRKMILNRHPKVRVRSALRNRTSNVPLARIIPIEALREQLEYAQKLRYEPQDIHWIGGNTFYGKKGMFDQDFLHHLELSRLPDFELSIDKSGDQFILEVEGDWPDQMDWEDICLGIVNEMLYQESMRGMSALDIDVMYARAKSKAVAKLEEIRKHPGITLAEYGTRRRHSHVWQKWIIEAMMEMLGDQMIGTSNSFFAREFGIDAKGTNAHELPMVYAALAAAAHPDDDEPLRQSQYEVLKHWRAENDENLLIALPDAFGTTQFLQNAPAELALLWKGFRPDSKDPYEATDELCAFWKSHAQNPQNKLVIYADGLDVRIPGHAINGEDMIALHLAVRDRVQDTYAMGTMLTNDFVGCVPGKPEAMKPLSIVFKVHTVNGHPAVKISDNPAKASSPSQTEIDRYFGAFGREGAANLRKTVV